MRIDVTPVTVDPKGLQTSTAVRLLGGVRLTSDELFAHGLSALHLGKDGALLAVSDQGGILRGRLKFDARGVPVAIAGAAVRPLGDGKGKPLRHKREIDAEGLALLADGSLLISFERLHRIWRYDSSFNRALAAASPRLPADLRDGMEALTAFPAAGPGAYLVGIEPGATFICRLGGDCRPTGAASLAHGYYHLVGFAALADQPRVLALLRAGKPLLGFQTQVLLVERPNRPTARAELLFTLKSPARVDNFEGIAVLPATRGWRIYLISDDNVSKLQETLLYAFEWNPQESE